MDSWKPVTKALNIKQIILGSVFKFCFMLKDSGQIIMQSSYTKDSSSQHPYAQGFKD